MRYNGAAWAGQREKSVSVKEALKQRYYARLAQPALVAMVQEAYAKWVTIGADGSAPDGKKGGTPVQIDDSGNIVAGPKSLQGHHVDSIPKRKNLFGDAGKSGTQGRLFGPDDAMEGKGPSAAERSRWGENVAFKPDGRVVGHAFLGIDDIEADPDRFQFKVSGIGEEGVTEELKEVKRFRPEFGGQLLVWKDPEDGKTYVVNGHHRHELAKRTGYEGKLPVFAVDAKDAKMARALGALANIAEGRGTAVDAAKFMRDMGVGVEEVREHGISLKGRVADEGVALSKLSDRLFKRLVNEDLRESRALAIARELGDKPEFQDKLARILEKRETKGRAIADATVAEMAKEMAETPTVRLSHTDLFGTWEDEDSLFVERNELKTFIKGQLSEEKRTFKSVSRQGRDARLSEAGNVLDSERNRELAGQAASDYELFEKFANLKGPISHAVNAAAAELRQNPKRRKQIGQRLVQEIRELIRSSDGGGKEAFAKSFCRDSTSSAGAWPGIVWPEESLVERFARAYDALGYPAYRPAPSAPTIREMVLRAYHELVDVERYAKRRPDDYVRDERGRFAETPGGKKSESAAKPAKRQPEQPNKQAGAHPSHPALENLFPKKELSLPEGSSHTYRTKPAAYAAASRVKPAYDSLMDEGQGVEQRLGAVSVSPSDKQQFSDLMDAFEAGTTKGPYVILAPIKGEKRALEKLQKYGGNWGQMKDLVRGTVAVDSLDDIRGAVDAVREELEAQGWQLAERPNDRFSKPTPAGYRDVQLSLRAPNGLICELQVNTKAMIAAKEKYGHPIYEKARTLEESIKKSGRKPTAKESRQLNEWNAQMAAIFGKAWKQLGGT